MHITPTLPGEAEGAILVDKIGKLSYFVDSSTTHSRKHFVVNYLDGETHKIAFSASRPMNRVELARWIDLGKPQFRTGSTHGAPWTPVELEVAWLRTQVKVPYPEHILQSDMHLDGTTYRPSATVWILAVAILAIIATGAYQMIF